MRNTMRNSRWFGFSQFRRSRKLFPPVIFAAVLLLLYCLQLRQYSNVETGDFPPAPYSYLSQEHGDDNQKTFKQVFIVGDPYQQQLHSPVTQNNLIHRKLSQENVSEFLPTTSSSSLSSSSSNFDSRSQVDNETQVGHSVPHHDFAIKNLVINVEQVKSSLNSAEKENQRSTDQLSFNGNNTNKTSETSEVEREIAVEETVVAETGIGEKMISKSNGVTTAAATTKKKQISTEIPRRKPTSVKTIKRRTTSAAASQAQLPMQKIHRMKSFKYVTKETNMTCKLPILEPFHASILPFIRSPPAIECISEDYPLLFQLDDDATLVRLNRIETYGFDFCCFTPFTRKNGDDEQVNVPRDCIPITEAKTEIPFPVENIIVSCRHKVTDTFRDIDLFSLPRINPTELLKRSQEQPSIHSKAESKLNVVILGIDAVSNMNFQRTMPLSRNYLVNDLKALTFEGYTKVGDNTLPNAMAILTGHSLKEIKKSHWPSETVFLDKVPFIWKNYSSHGYFTSYAEDEPEISTFNYVKKGFLNPPVDFYARPSLLQQDLLIGHENLSNGNLCYGPRMSFDVLLKYMRNLAFSVKTNSHKNITSGGNLNITTASFNYFQYIWANALFHDFEEFPSLGDAALLDTLQWFHKNMYLNNTVFIVMSDHGIRWGDIREKTIQGKIEERMPLLNIVLPPWFQRKFSKAYGNMVENKYKLTSHFDLHETLQDILEAEKQLDNESIGLRAKILEAIFKNNGNKLNKVPRGISLFLPIPTNRDCAKAGIDPHWCVCQQKEVIDPSFDRVQEGAREIVKYLNSVLLPHPSCVVLELKRVLSAERSIDGVKLTGEETQKSEDIFLDITLETSPGLALFEASISWNASVALWKVQEDLSRINLYGDQSYCVDNPRIKLYCFCVD